MLSRHFLRSKVLQALYACEIAPVEYAYMESELKKNIAHLNTLGVMQLSMLIEFRSTAESVMEDGKKKFMPTEDERNPSLRLVDNRFLRCLEDNFDLRKLIDCAKIQWQNEQELFRKAFFNFRETSLYGDYVKFSDDDFDTDKQLVLQLFKCLVNDEGLRTAVCEKSLLWEDDFDQIAQYNFMMLKTFDESFDASTVIPVMYDERFEKDVADVKFAIELLKKTYMGRKDTDELIKTNLKGWDFDRVAMMDILIINMAVAELTSFSSIPEKVTIDEYIELSKEYSTDRSKLFVNGILDKLIVDLRMNGRINKSGRGLAFGDETE